MMSFIKSNNLIVFLLLSIIYLYFEIMDYDDVIINIATPVIISVLLVFYLIVAKRKANYLYLFVLVLQLIGSMFITRQGETNFLVGFSIFFVINILLVFIVTSKLSIIKSNDIYTKYAPFTLIFLVIIYYVFAQIGGYKILFLIYGLMAAIFVSMAYHYHIKSFRDSSFWFLFGALAYLVCDVFTGLYFLVAKNIYYDVLDSFFYLTAIYSINYAMILDAKEKESKVTVD